LDNKDLESDKNNCV